VAKPSWKAFSRCGAVSADGQVADAEDLGRRLRRAAEQRNRRAERGNREYRVTPVRSRDVQEYARAEQQALDQRERRAHNDGQQVETAAR
jgi:hypothetical protein